MFELLEKLKVKCVARGLEYSDDVLTSELEDAIAVVNERRGYVPSPSSPYEVQYKSLIVKMALYAITKIGAEGETAHSENGISRVYATAGDYPEDLLNEIIPRIKV
jgi:hypothetical protein